MLESTKSKHRRSSHHAFAKRCRTLLRTTCTPVPTAAWRHAREMSRAARCEHSSKAQRSYGRNCNNFYGKNTSSHTNQPRLWSRARNIAGYGLTSFETAGELNLAQARRSATRLQL